MRNGLTYGESAGSGVYRNPVNLSILLPLIFYFVYITYENYDEQNCSENKSISHEISCVNHEIPLELEMIDFRLFDDYRFFQQ